MGLKQKQVFQKAVFPRGLQYDGKNLETAEIRLFSARWKGLTRET